jgi:intracellular multiplication protein IcmX
MIVDMLSTYDVSFCPYFNSIMSSAPNSPQRSMFANGVPAVFQTCLVANQSNVALNVVNPVPNVPSPQPGQINGLGFLFLPTTNASDPQMALVPQLNSNTLLGPLLYVTETQQQGQQNNAGGNGLTANNQAQQAANFIRYVSSAVAPQQQIDFTTFQALMGQLTSATTMTQAQVSLATYFANMRSYAALISVGVGNLYDMLSHRMPQTVSAVVDIPGCIPSASNPCTKKVTRTSSAALVEYEMATNRIMDPKTTQSWKTSINAASGDTVQKEIAVLLSEINYQLYLNRQQQERLLLTNSMILLQVSRLVAPSPPKASNAQ